MITACDVSYGFPSVPRQKLQRPDNFNYACFFGRLSRYFSTFFRKICIVYHCLEKGSRRPRFALHTSGTRSAVLSNLAIYRAGHSLSALLRREKPAKTRIALSFVRAASFTYHRELSTLMVQSLFTDECRQKHLARTNRSDAQLNRFSSSRV